MKSSDYKNINQSINQSTLEHFPESPGGRLQKHTVQKQQQESAEEWQETKGANEERSIDNGVAGQAN